MSRPHHHESEAPRRTDELDVLAGQTRFFVSKISDTPPASRSTSSSPKDQVRPSDVHASLKDDLNMMSQQDHMSYGTSFAARGAVLDQGQPLIAASYPVAHMPPAYGTSSSLPDIYNDPRGGFGGSGVQEHLYQQRMSYPESTAGINEFSPLFAVPPTLDGSEDEITWGGFVAGLGVDN